MIFYIIIFIFLAVFSFFEVLGLKRRDKIFVFAFFTLFFFILSFIRWETGTDWKVYNTFFNKCIIYGNYESFEIGFNILNIFVKNTFDNYTVLLLLSAIIIYSFQTKGILYFSNYPITSLFILYSITFAHVFFIRQTVSVAILFFSVRYIQEKKLLLFLFCIAIATLFHRTSIVFGLAWFVFNLRLSRKQMFITALLSIGVSVLVALAMKFLGDLLGSVIKMKIDAYLGENASSNNFGSNFSILTIIVKGFANKILVLFVGFYLIDRVNDNYKYIRNYLNLYWFGTVIYFSTISLSVALVRLSFPYDIFQIVLVPMLFDAFKRKSTHFIIFYGILLYLFTRLYLSIYTYFDLYIPFKTVFSNL